MRTYTFGKPAAAAALVAGLLAACTVDRRGHSDGEGGTSGASGRGGSAGANAGRGGDAGAAGSDAGSDSGGAPGAGAGGAPEQGGASGEAGAPNPGEACGDGKFVAGVEACDDGNDQNGDGCNSACEVEVGYGCTQAAGGGASSCAPICADGLRIGTEAGASGCDDGNFTAGDGCAPNCTVEVGFSCSGTPSVCAPICGDGKVVGSEALAGGCDDGDKDALDGCSATCNVETGYVCTGAPSACVKTCGNGVLDAGEKCDDGNTATGDGCAACAVEPGFTCTGASNCKDINECDAQPSPCKNAAEVCTNTVGSYTCACPTGTRLNAGKCMTILQFIAGFAPVDVNADGTVVVGANGDFPARWSQSDSTVRTLVNDSAARVVGVSGDGHVVIGTLNGTAARWVDLQTGQALLTGSVVLNVAAVNKDGSVIVGTRSADNFLFRWKSGVLTYFNPATASPDVSNGMTVAALSDDGNLVAGKFGDPFYDQGYRWNLSTSSADVFKTADPFSSVQPRDISGDGTTIVGQLWGANGAMVSAGFSWKPKTLTKLNSIAQADQAIAINSNGTRAISATTYWPSLTQSSVDLLTYAGSVGGDISLITSMTATNLSSDGKTIVGSVKTSQGVTRGFILRVP